MNHKAYVIIDDVWVKSYDGHFVHLPRPISYDTHHVPHPLRSYLHSHIWNDYEWVYDKYGMANTTYNKKISEHTKKKANALLNDGRGYLQLPLATNRRPVT